MGVVCRTNGFLTNILRMYKRAAKKEAVDVKMTIANMSLKGSPVAKPFVYLRQDISRSKERPLL